MVKEVCLIRKNQGALRKPCLLFGMVLILCACCALFMYMEGNWAADNYARERIVILAAGLLLSSVGLCYYATKTEPKLESELQFLLVEDPPSYETVVLAEDPPPSYQSIIHNIIIIPQQSTR